MNGARPWTHRTRQQRGWPRRESPRGRQFPWGHAASPRCTPQAVCRATGGSTIGGGGGVSGAESMQKEARERWWEGWSDGASARDRCGSWAPSWAGHVNNAGAVEPLPETTDGGRQREREWRVRRRAAATRVVSVSRRRLASMLVEGHPRPSRGVRGVGGPSAAAAVAAVGACVVAAGRGTLFWVWIPERKCVCGRERVECVSCTAAVGGGGR